MRHSTETALALQDQSRSIHVRQIIHTNERGTEQRLNYLTPSYYRIDYRMKRRLYWIQKLGYIFAMFILPQIIILGSAAYISVGVMYLAIILGSPILFMVAGLSWPSNHFQKKRELLDDRRKLYEFTAALELYQCILRMQITLTYVDIQFVNSMGYEQRVTYKPHDEFESHKRYNDGSLNSYKSLDLTTSYYEYCV